MSTVLTQLGLMLSLTMLMVSQLDNRNRILLFSQGKLTSKNPLFAFGLLGTTKKGKQKCLLHIYCTQQASG